MYNNHLSREENIKGPILYGFQVFHMSYTHGGQFQASNLILLSADLERDAQTWI